MKDNDIVNDLSNHLPELRESCQLAMDRAVAAPYPWCGDFGNLAQTLDCTIVTLEREESTTSGPNLSLSALRQRLNDLSYEMRATAKYMRYHGGFNARMKNRADELINASRMVTEWVNSIDQKADE